MRWEYLVNSSTFDRLDNALRHAELVAANQDRDAVLVLGREDRRHDYTPQYSVTRDGVAFRFLCFV